MAKEKYLLDNSLGYKLFHASRLMSNRLNKNFRDAGFDVTYEQWQILSRLYEKDGQTQNQLANKNERDQPSVSRLVDNMIKRGLVARISDKADKRINLIYLTDKGRDMENVLTALALKTIDDASDSIDSKELEICLRVLDQVRENLK
ncbi:MarR family transcriptional regulator [Cytobacillus oceanisediminis]|uniref:MarR family transcriptional regulator n=1 Tax=Cytobacillus oceanisediminis TaxID=665099 RepID=A0A2V2ZSY8_9BACI|nr:MarR family transcriptional regulator [Cytobacillus oceanisediminis]PWW20041.1 MarR family transcriptional regulator [Cytobacillus oceanisediminis]